MNLSPANLDVIGPAYRFVRNLLEGPHWTFDVTDGGYTGRVLGKMLNENEIRCWGIMGLMQGEFSINVTVRKIDAARAQTIFDKYGVVVSNPAHDVTCADPGGLTNERKSKMIAFWFFLGAILATCFVLPVTYRNVEGLWFVKAVLTVVGVWVALDCTISGIKLLRKYRGDYRK